MQCLGNCGFFGNPKTENYCSQCFLKLKKDLPKEASLLEDPLPKPQPPSQSEPQSLPQLESQHEQRPELQPEPQPELQHPLQSESQIEKIEKLEKLENNKCFHCHKKLKITDFTCRCHHYFCSLHRHAEIHQCTFDYQSFHKKNIQKNNQLIQAEKITKF